MHHATRGTLIRRRLLEKKLRVGTGRLREKQLLLEKVLLVASLERARAGQGRLTLAKGRLRHGTTSDRS